MSDRQTSQDQVREQAAEGRPANRPETNVLRSSAVMALGTVVSRGTGFVRTAVLVFALGTMALGDTYNTANTIPNVVYDLLLGGILTSVLVPLIVRARERDRQYGEEYERRLFTLIVIGLAALSIIAVLAAPVLIDLYATRYTPEQRALAITFARFFLPQIFFYGVGAFAQAILNSRGSFAAPMWAPVINNLVVIGVVLGFLAITSDGVTPTTIQTGEIQLLGLGTTGGIVLQAAALLPSLRKVGFRWRPRFDFRPGELREAGRMASWTLVYVATTQVGFAVTTNLANAAGVRGQQEGIGYGVGFTPYFNAYQLFQLPYAIIAVSVITALLPRMSAHAAEHRFDLVRDDFSTGLGLASAVILPCAAMLLALGSEIAVLIFAHQRTTMADALMIGNVLKMFALAMVPFAAFQLLLRVFYAMRDTKTPALISLANVTIVIGAAMLVFRTIPTQGIVIGLAGALGLSYTAGSIIAVAVLRRRLGRLDGHYLLRSHLRVAASAIPAVIFAYAMHLAFTETFGMHTWTVLCSLLLGGGGGSLLYVLFARRLRVTEVENLYQAVVGRLFRRVST